MRAILGVLVVATLLSPNPAAAAMQVKFYTRGDVADLCKGGGSGGGDSGHYWCTFPSGGELNCVNGQHKTCWYYPNGIGKRLMPEPQNLASTFSSPTAAEPPHPGAPAP